MLSTEMVRGVRRGPGRPGSVAGFVVAVLAALYGALVGSAVGVLLGGYPGPPSDARAEQVAVAAFDHVPANVAGPVIYCDLICPQWDGRDEVVAYDAPPDRTDRVVVLYNVDRTAAPDVLVRAHDRLAAAGWRVDPVWIQGDRAQQFEASHDGLNIRIDVTPAEPSSGGSYSSMDIVISKNFTFVSVAALIVGTVAGICAGWFIAVWALRRHRGHGLPRRILTIVVGLPFLIIGPLSILFTTMFTVAMTNPEVTPKIMQVSLIVVQGLWPVTAAALASAVLAVALMVTPGAPRTKPTEVTAS